MRLQKARDGFFHSDKRLHKHLRSSIRATKVHDGSSLLGPLFRTDARMVRTQNGVTASAGQQRGDVEIRNYLRDQSGSRSLVLDLSISHERFGSSSHMQQMGCSRICSTSMHLCALLRSARSIIIGNSTLTIRTFPRHCQHLHPQARRFLYRAAGRPRRTSMPLECQRNNTTWTRSCFRDDEPRPWRTSLPGRALALKNTCRNARSPVLTKHL